MKTSGFFVGSLLAVGLAGSALTTSAPTREDRFTLIRAIPNTVFLLEASRHNPARDFLSRYWGEVFDALAQSGIGEDLLGLLGSVSDTEQTTEVQRVRDRMTQLFKSVDWEQLGATENAFAERFVPPTPAELAAGRPPITLADMVWLCRANGEGAARHYEGMADILEAVVDEVNKALGKEALTLQTETLHGAKVTSVNLLAAVPGAPPLPLSLALRDDLVIIGLREHLFNDVLELLNGSSSMTTLRDDARFKAAFAQLPQAEDKLAFFDVQALLAPAREFADTVLGLVAGPEDITRNTDGNPEVAQLNKRAVAAYRRGEFNQALALTRQGYELSPHNSLVLYNLACFNALVGNKDEALAWLGKAVEAGFYAPKKIASDRDLDSLRGRPEYEAALAKATDLAWAARAKDVAINAARTGEVFSLRMQVRQAHEAKEYERGLQLIEQAYAIAPKDSMVLYIMACFHALLGHENKALDFLEEAVDAGFYCPKHMSEDTDLDSLRGNERYAAAWAKAKARSTELATRNQREELAMARRLIDRLANAVGVLDYSASVEKTDGYTVSTESIVALVSDAGERPIYPVFGKRRSLTDFDKYVPEEAASFSVSAGIDPGELYKFIEDTIRMAGPKGDELLAKWGELQKQFGIDVREDIFDWIDGDSISVTLADGGGSIWLLKVTDEQVARAKVGTAIEFLSKRLPEQLGKIASKNPALAGLAMLAVRTSPVEHAQLAGFQNLHVGMSPQPVVWGVTAGYIVFGSSADAVAACLATARGDHPSVRSNARAMSEAIVPDGPFASVSLTDQRGLGEEVATGLGVASMVYGMLGTFIPDPRVRPLLAKISGMLSKLVPVARKIDFYKSSASHTTFDGKVWRSRGVTHYVQPAERTRKDTE